MEVEEYIDQPEIAVPATILMATECLELILTTKQMDVLKRRFESFGEHVNYLKMHENDANYLLLCERGFNYFRNSYPNKIFKEHFFSLRKPSQIISLLPNLYIDCLFRTAVDYGKEMALVINNLKRMSSKYNKLEQFIIYIETVLEELNQLNQKESIAYQELEKNLTVLKSSKDKIASYL